MYGYIVGRVTKVSPKYIIEENNGIGYMVIVPNPYSFTVGNEYKIKLGSKYNYIDLLLYNIKYKCYVAVELKVTDLKKEYTGQIMTYMNYID